MTKIALQTKPESYWENLAGEFNTLMRHLSNQPKQLWEQVLSGGNFLLEKCKELKLTHLTHLFNRFMDHAYDSIRGLMQSALEAMDELANGIAQAVTENVWPWLKGPVEFLVREMAKAGIHEIIKEAVNKLIEYIRENWHTWAAELASA
jgi:hypothetical protein